MAASDDIGTRGEAIFTMLLTDFCGRRRPFFKIHFLGDKFATFDYLVELIDAPLTTAYFFVQVKTTQAGYRTDKNGTRRLKVGVERQDLLRMQNYPAPTYVIGIDEPGIVGYIISANGDCPSSLSAMPTNYELNCANLALLWQEVNAYWTSRNMILPASQFGV